MPKFLIIFGIAILAFVNYTIGSEIPFIFW